MAIKQSRYIDITYTVASSVVGEKVLDGLVFTNGTCLNSFEDKEGFEDGTKVLVFKNLDQVAEAFDTDTDEYKFAQKYFMYMAVVSGKSPKQLAFVNLCKPENAEELNYIIDRFGDVVKKFEDFSTFTIFEELDNETVEAINALNVNMNGGARLFCIPTTATTKDEIVSGTKAKGIHYVYAGSDYDKRCVFIPMSLTATIDYKQANGTISYMYKLFDDDLATVFTDKMADKLDTARINYVGQTSSNGSKFSFYQRGFNADGTDTAVFMNESWMESEIAAGYFNLITQITKIPANNIGSGYVTGIIMDVVKRAISNGSILPGKTLTNTDKQLITAYSNDQDAVSDVYGKGFWLSVSVQKGLPDNPNEYYCSYRLIYSKGDAIRKVEGTHNLI